LLQPKRHNNRQPYSLPHGPAPADAPAQLALNRAVRLPPGCKWRQLLSTLLHPKDDDFKFPAATHETVRLQNSCCNIPCISDLLTGAYKDCNRCWDMKVHRSAAHTGLRTKSLKKK
jgi:hypothetical protein